MRRERGLLDRLRSGGAYVAPSTVQRTEHVLESIQHHLAKLLNTRQGDSAAFPEYGLPALSDTDKTGRAEALRRDLEQTLRDYEPRLRGVRVMHVDPDPDNPLLIRFQITGRPVGVTEQVTFRFDTAVDAVGGFWKVKA